MNQLEHLRELREDRKETQAEIAHQLCLSRQAYQRYESGNRSIPLDCLIKLADYYDVSLDYLLGRTRNPARLL